MKRSRFLVVVLLLAASWAQAAYVVMLRNGERIVAKSKYTVKGAMALITLKNGTLTSLPVSQIDVKATDKVNALGLGDAVSLDWVDTGGPPPTPTATPSITSLGHINPDVAKPVNDAARPTPTPGIGFRDTKFKDAQVAKAFQQGLENVHLYLYRTSQGTNPAYLFIEIQVNGQPEVLKALEAVTATYQVLAQSAPERAPGEVEVQMLNESGKEAGVFRLSAADAAELATGKVSAQEFFVKHVIF